MLGDHQDHDDIGDNVDYDTDDDIYGDDDNIPQAARRRSTFLPCLKKRTSGRIIIHEIIRYL